VTGLTAAVEYSFQVIARNGDSIETARSAATTGIPYGFVNEYTPDEQCTVYTVQAGDTLESIAAATLGDRNRYGEIIDANIDRYPSLVTNRSFIRTGWTLIISCENGVTPGEGQEDETDGDGETEQDGGGGYTVRIRVISEQESPVSHASVSIKPRGSHVSTDNQGIALFKHVTPGQYRIAVAYEGATGEEKVNLTGDVEAFEITIRLQTDETAETKMSPWGWLGWAACAVLGSAICISWWRKKRKHESYPD
jgi:hypothetical protein